MIQSILNLSQFFEQDFSFQIYSYFAFFSLDYFTFNDLAIIIHALLSKLVAIILYFPRSVSFDSKIYEIIHNKIYCSFLYNLQLK